jgi:predicted dehydrogenase
MKKVRVGIIGAKFAADFHLRNLTRLRGNKVEVLAVAARSRESAANLARKYDIPDYYDDYRRILERRDIDLVDLCLPTDLHEPFALEAAAAGKHILCEKPLTGYFGQDRPEKHVGTSVPKREMLAAAMAGCNRVRLAVKENQVKFLYGENWVYAPPLLKLKSLVKAAGGTILDMRAETSHSGSHAWHAMAWKTSGGGSLMRLGAHPVGAVLHLKHYEGILKTGKPILPKAVTAEVGYHTKIASFLAEEKKYVVSRWEDVEDWAVMVLTFTDNSQATVFASDQVLGGVRNVIEVFLSNAVMKVNINPHNVLEVYAPDGNIFADEYLAEKLETKAGWSQPSPDEDWMRGFPQEWEDFVEAILQDREPVSGIDLACEVVEVIYAAYVAAEEGKRYVLR